MKFERKRDIIAERNRLRDKLEEKNKIIEKLQSKLRGEKHEVGAQCNGCVNLLRGTALCMGTEVEERMCKLDIKCKDRVEKQSVMSNCNFISCRYNANGKCENEEKRKECVEVARKVLCLGDNENEA